MSTLIESPNASPNPITLTPHVPEGLLINYELISNYNEVRIDYFILNDEANLITILNLYPFSEEIFHDEDFQNFLYELEESSIFFCEEETYTLAFSHPESPREVARPTLIVADDSLAPAGQAGVLIHAPQPDGQAGDYRWALFDFVRGWG